MKKAMTYEQVNGISFYKEIDTEEKARLWVWRSRFLGKDFVCPSCGGERYWQHKAQAEMRECSGCHRQVRMRAGTIFQNSKIPILTWVRAIFLVMQDKRGVSALQLKRQLGMKSYGTTWTILHKIRESLRQRDEGYKLKDVIELDGASFGRRATGTQATVLVAVESKDWIDEKGRSKSKAGFAKVIVADETKQAAQKFVDEAIKPGSMVNTDAAPALTSLSNVDAENRVMGNDPVALDSWLPWVHKFISNAKAWILGTHHGISKQHVGRYLAEYTYRFNRRHDPNGLFHRALTACSVAQPKTVQVLFG
jgi:transposase-like protein